MIGIDTAASAGFTFQSPNEASSNQSFAIPINSGLSLAKLIEAGAGSSTVHIGATAFLGVEIATHPGNGDGGQFGGSVGGGFGNGASTAGATIAGVVTSSPAQEAGMAQGDVITSVNREIIGSPDALTSALAPFHPGDKVTIGWTDGSGKSQSATVQLTSGPPQ